MYGNDSNCEFCKIVRGAEKSRIVCGTSDALAFFPLHPVIPGHTLVIPKEHVSDLWSASPALVSKVMDAVLKTGNAIRNALSPDGMNVISSAGEAASQSIFHLHIHLVPRWHSDRIGEIWPPSPPLSAHVLDDTAELIRSRCL